MGGRFVNRLGLGVGKTSQGHGDHHSQQYEVLALPGDFQKADAEMNDVYKSLVKKLGDDKSSVRRLRAAQRAWLVYRDAEAEFVADQYDGGTMKPMVHSSALEGVTRKRTDQLKLDLEDASR